MLSALAGKWGVKSRTARSRGPLASVGRVSASDQRVVQPLCRGKREADLRPVYAAAKVVGGSGCRGRRQAVLDDVSQVLTLQEELPATLVHQLREIIRLRDANKAPLAATSP